MIFAFAYHYALIRNHATIYLLMKTLQMRGIYNLKKHLVFGLAIIGLALASYGIYQNVLTQPPVVDAQDEQQLLESPTDQLFVQMYESQLDIGLAADTAIASAVFTEDEKAVLADIRDAFYTATANPLDTELSKEKSQVYLQKAALKLSYMVEHRSYDNFRNRLTDIWYQDVAVKNPSLQMTRWIAYIRAHIFDFIAL